jgi:hypothetical protein
MTRNDFRECSDVIKEALGIIECNMQDINVVKTQCGLIKKYANELSILSKFDIINAKYSESQLPPPEEAGVVK